jgi:hypothetical protein
VFWSGAKLCAEKKSISCYEFVKFGRIGWISIAASFYACRGKVTEHYGVSGGLMLTSYWVF